MLPAVPSLEKRNSRHSKAVHNTGKANTPNPFDLMRTVFLTSRAINANTRERNTVIRITNTTGITDNNCRDQLSLPIKKARKAMRKACIFDTWKDAYSTGAGAIHSSHQKFPDRSRDRYQH